MTGENSKFVTRFMAVLFVAAVFAGCAMMLSKTDRSLFAETQYSDLAD